MRKIKAPICLDYVGDTIESITTQNISLLNTNSLILFLPTFVSSFLPLFL